MTTPVSSTRIRGVLTPVVTPFDRDLMPDAKRLVRQCRWLLEQDVGLAVFGTNSEANSLSVAEKLALLDALRRGGPAGRADDAGHRLLRAERVGRADPPRGRSSGAAAC